MAPGKMAAWAGLKPVQFRQNHNPADERRATWLELFFDLVFVVAVAQLAHTLHDDLSARGAFRFVMLFVPVWWAWMSCTYYADQFDNDDLPFRLATFASMFFVAAMSTFIHVGMAEYSSGFAFSYVGLRVVVVLLYVRARHGASANVVFLNRFIAGNALGMLVWLASLAVDPPVRYAVWGVAMAIEIMTPVLALRGHGRGPVASASHIPERIGLFTIIVLGETVIAVVNGAGGTAWDARTIATAVASLALGAAMWWLYFPRLEGTTIKRRLFWAFAYPYAHLPVFLSVVTIGVGVSFAIEHSDEPALSRAEGLALGGGVAVFLAAVTVAQFGTVRSLPSRTVAVRGTGATMAALGAVWLGSAGALWTVLGFALLLAVVVALDPAPGEDEVMHSLPVPG